MDRSSVAWFPAFAAASVLWWSPAGAEELALKLRRGAAAGKAVTVTDRISQTVSVVVKGADGKAVRDQKKTEDREDVYTETVAAGTGGFPDRFARKYAKSVRTRDGKPTPAVRQGREISFEKHDGKFAAEGDAVEPFLTPAELKELAAEAQAESRRDRREFLLPTKPVKEGDGWTVSAADLAALLMPDAVAEPGAAPVEVKLTKVYEKDGVRCGVLGVQTKLPVRAVKNLRFDSPAEMEVKLSLEGALDGKGALLKVSSAAKVGGTATAEMMGKRVIVSLTAERMESFDRSAETAPEKSVEKPVEKAPAKAATK